MNSQKTLALLFAAASLFASCSNDFDLGTIFSDSVSEVNVSIADADYTETINTRSSHSVDPSRGFVTTWTVGDTIGIYPIGADQVAFPISGGEGSSTAKFDGGAWSLRASRQYGAYYPFSKKNYYIDETKIPVSYLGQKQTGDNNLDHLSDYDFMAAAAVSPDANGAVNMTMQHLGAFLRLTITAPEAKSYTKARLSSDAAIFTTDATINLQDGSLTPTKKADVLTLLLDNVTTTEPNQTITAYMMLAPISASDISAHPISVTLFDDNGVSYVADLTFTSVIAGKSYAKSASVVLDGLDDSMIQYNIVMPDYLHITLNTTLLKSDILTEESKIVYVISENEDYVYVPNSEVYQVGRDDAHWYYVNGIATSYNRCQLLSIDDSGNCSSILVNGGVWPKYYPCTTYFYRIAIIDGDKIKYGPVKSFTPPIYSPVEPTRGYLIDMGLSVKWGRYNLGSSYNTPEKQGFHFAWGELEPKQAFTLENYQYQSGGTYIDLDWNEELSISGDPRYDPSERYYPEKCRMPTEIEMRELYDNCSWYWTKYNGIKGFQIVGPSGNNIFLPCEGSNGYECDHYNHYGTHTIRYWTSRVWDAGYMSFCAYGLYISPDLDNPYKCSVFCHPEGTLYWDARYVGYPIRSVADY